MNLIDILKASRKPALYDKGTAVMWTDEYISQQLLAVHLNENIDLGSRKKDTIEKTVQWILKKLEPGKTLNILDLGCGPGLYTSLLAEKGHNVTGVDFSKASINHAVKSAEDKKLNIEYINKNYLELSLPQNSFDAVILIYTDLGALLPEERDILLGIITDVLKPGGIFIFDVLNDTQMKDMVTPNSWDISEKGFWKKKPYLALSNSYLYEDEKVILYQHLLLDSENNMEVYRFWTHLFSHGNLTNMLQKHSFGEVSFYEDVLPESDLWSGKNVTFCRAVNNK